MKSIFTFLAVLFFYSSFAQSAELDYLRQVGVLENTMLTPEYLDFRRVARTRFRDYSQTTMDSIAYYYPFDTSRLYTIVKHYSLENDTYKNVRIDSSFFDGVNEWTLIKQYDWNDDLSFFELAARTHRYANGDSLLTEDYVPASDEWVNARLNTRKFYPSGDMKKIVFSSWNADISEWELVFSFAYDEHRKIVEFKSKNSWDIYDWDELGRLISSLKKTYVEPNYVNVDSTVYHWVNDSSQLGLFYKWDINLAEWIYSKKMELNYNSDGLLAQEIRLDSIGVNQYTNSFKRNYSYDANNREVEMITYGWIDGAWKLSWQRSHQFDSEGHLILRRSAYWDNDLNGLKVKSEDRYYFEEYENGLVGIQNLPKVEAMVRPNPASDYIVFSVKGLASDFDVIIYSSLGCSVLSQKGADGANINIQQLPAGQYFYILKGKDFGATGSFVK